MTLRACCHESRRENRVRFKMATVLVAVCLSASGHASADAGSTVVDNVSYEVHVKSGADAWVVLNVDPSGGRIPTKSNWSCRYTAPKRVNEQGEFLALCQYKLSDGSFVASSTTSMCPVGKGSIRTLEVADP